MKIIKRIFHKGEMAWTKLLCLALGLALGLLVLAEVIYERTSLHFVPQIENTYMVYCDYQMKKTGEEMEGLTNTSGGVVSQLQRICPYIENVSRWTYFYDGNQWTDEGGKAYQIDIIAADPDFFDIFKTRIVQGDNPHKVFAEPREAYISTSLLKRLGGGNVVGKTLSYRNSPDYKLTIVGVFEDYPENTHLPHIDVITSISSMDREDFKSSENLIGNDRYRSYVVLKSGVTSEQILPYFEKMKQMTGIDKAYQEGGVDVRFYLKGLEKVFLDSSTNRIMNILYLSFGIMLLVVSLFNYLLLSLTVVINRAKNIATLRCYGADNRDVFRKTIKESLLLGFIALLLAVLIATALSDFIERLTAHSVSVFLTPNVWVPLSVITLLFLILCAVIPPLLYMRVPITYAYRRFSDTKRSWKLALLFFQICLSVLFILLTCLLNWQYNYLIHYDKGFDSNGIIYFSSSQMEKDRAKRMVEELRKNPDISGITWGYQNLSSECSGNNVFEPATGRTLFNFADFYQVGDDYFSTLRIPIVEGRAFLPQSNDSVQQEVMVSERFARQYMKLLKKTGSIVGEELRASDHERVRVCGVYADIRTSALIEGVYDTRPSMMSYNYRPFGKIYIRLQNTDEEKVSAVAKRIRQMGEDESIQVVTLDSQIAFNYTQLQNVKDSILMMGAFVVLIMLIGLVGFLRDEIGHRRAELAIRMIHGASFYNVGVLFLRDLMIIVLPALLAGCLLTIYLIRQILVLFVVKMPYQWYHYVLPLVLLLVIIMGFFLYQIRRASRMNPIENIRNE